MGALRRHQAEELEGRDEVRPDLSRPAQKSSFPRWLTVSTVVVYCAVFWMVIWAAGSWGLNLVRVAVAGGSE